MLSGAVARRYAQALLELGKEAGQVDILENELGRFLSLLEEHKELERILYHPSIVVSEKKAIVDPILQAGYSPATRSFILLTVERRREAYLADIYQEFVRMANEVRGLVRAEVVSAIELQDEEIDRLKDQLKRMTGKQIQLEKRVDPALMAGLVIRIGDKIIDGSVVGKLRGLKDALMKAHLPSA